MDFIFLVGGCLELGVPWEKSKSHFKENLLETTTEIVHILKCTVQREKQTNKQTHIQYGLTGICVHSPL